jgi:glycosyltransferase involved in cell wall biosynthesis
MLHVDQHFDVVWAMMAHSAGIPAAIFKKRHPEVPYVLTLQEGDPPQEIEKTMRPLWPWFVQAFTRADMVTAISTFLGAWARSRKFNGPLEIIPNGVDSKKFIGEKIAHERMVLVTSSRLVHKNAVDVIIRALPLLPPYVQLVVAGTGVEEANLRKLATELKVENRVEFKGFVSHDALPALLHSSDIFIRPSRSEGMGNSFIEAFAAGLPVIATQEGGIADFLFDAKRNPDKPTTGWTVDKDSPEQVAMAVKDIIANPEAAARVIETAKSLALSNYDWDLIARSMHEKVFGKVLKSS